jgi:hypothetical protein
MATPTAAQIIAAYPSYKTMDPNAVVPDYLATGGVGKGNNTPYAVGGNPNGASTNVSPNAPANTTVDPTAAFNQAQGTVGNADTSSLSTAAGSIQNDAKAKSDALTAEIAPTKNIYSTLASQLKASFDAGQAATTKQQTQAVGAAAQNAAASGFDTSSGFEAAISASISADYAAKLQTAANNYGVQVTQLGAQESKDISTLTSEAADALLTGDTATANINAQMINIKQQQSALITTAATAIMNAENKNDADYYKSLYQGELLDLKQQSIDLAANKLAGAGTGGVDTSSVTGQNANNPPSGTAVGAFSSDGNWYWDGNQWIPSYPDN